MLLKTSLSLSHKHTCTHLFNTIHSSVNLHHGQTTYLIRTEGLKTRLVFLRCLYIFAYSFWGLHSSRETATQLLLIFILSVICSFILLFFAENGAQLVASTWVSVIAWSFAAPNPLIAFFSLARGRKDSLLVSLLCFLFFSHAVREKEMARWEFALC